MASKLILVGARKCKSCEKEFCMEDVGLSQSNARHRLRFRQMKTCGEEPCKKKAMGSRKTQNPPKIYRRKRLPREEVGRECSLYLSHFIRTVHPDLVDGMSSPGPDLGEYRKMMGIRC
jgi:hypothetical protein